MKFFFSNFVLFLGEYYKINEDGGHRNGWNTDETGRLDHQGALSAKTVRDICIVLKSVIRYGEEEYQMHRIATNTVLPKRKKTVHEVLSAQELRRIRDWLANSPEDARCIGLLLCMYTGMRLGEICALRWSDIDVRRKTICVSHTLQRIPCSRQESIHNAPDMAYDQEGQRTGTGNMPRTRVITDDPKSVSSFRIIPIPAEIYPAIREMHRQNNKTEQKKTRLILKIDYWIALNLISLPTGRLINMILL